MSSLPFKSGLQQEIRQEIITMVIEINAPYVNRKSISDFHVICLYTCTCPAEGQTASALPIYTRNLNLISPIHTKTDHFLPIIALGYF